jgi:hypothetical protein
VVVEERCKKRIPRSDLIRQLGLRARFLDGVLGNERRAGEGRRGRGGDDVGVRHLAFWSASLASEVAVPKVGPNSVARCQRSGRTGFRWSAFNMRDYFIPLLLSDWEGNIG